MIDNIQYSSLKSEECEVPTSNLSHPRVVQYLIDNHKQTLNSLKQIALKEGLKEPTWRSYLERRAKKIQPKTIELLTAAFSSVTKKIDRHMVETDSPPTEANLVRDSQANLVDFLAQNSVVNEERQISGMNEELSGLFAVYRRHAIRHEQIVVEYVGFMGGAGRPEFYFLNKGGKLHFGTGNFNI